MDLFSISAAIDAAKFNWMRFKGARAVNLAGSEFKIVPEAIFGVRQIRGSDNDEIVIMATGQLTKINYAVSNRIVNKSVPFKGKVNIGQVKANPSAPRTSAKQPRVVVVKEKAQVRFNGNSILKKANLTVESLTKLRIEKLFGTLNAADLLPFKAWLIKKLTVKPKLQEWLITEYKAQPKTKPVTAIKTVKPQAPKIIKVPTSGKVALVTEDDDEDVHSHLISEKTKHRANFDVPELDVHDLPTEFGHIIDHYDAYSSSSNVKFG